MAWCYRTVYWEFRLWRGLMSFHQISTSHFGRFPHILHVLQRKFSSQRVIKHLMNLTITGRQNIVRTRSKLQNPIFVKGMWWVPRYACACFYCQIYFRMWWYIFYQFNRHVLVNGTKSHVAITFPTNEDIKHNFLSWFSKLSDKYLSYLTSPCVLTSSHSVFS